MDPTLPPEPRRRRRASSRAQGARFDLIHEASRALYTDDADDAQLLGLLRQTRDVFDADQVELTTYGMRTGDEITRTSIDAAGVITVRQPVEDEPEVRELLASSSTLRIDVQDHGLLASHLGARGLRDVLLAPLRVGDRIIGSLLIARTLRKPWRRVDAEDLELLETLANTASAAIANGHLVSSLADATARNSELHHRAYHDQLTRLANRGQFTQRVQEALDRRPAPGKLAIIFIDLDDFKAINDSLGHDAGDELLVAVGERLRAVLRPSDLAARLGGDEFAVLLENAETPEAAVHVAERILEQGRLPIHLGGKEVFVRSSLGIALNTDEHRSAADLLRNADLAMYEAKSGTKASYALFEPAMDDAVHTRLAMKAQLQRAVRHAEFVVHYQPIVSLADDQITGVEALVRWEHPDLGLLGPDRFIELAEETGVVRPIGELVLRRACEDAVAWQRRHPDHPPLAVHVNLATRDLQDPHITDDVERALRDSGLDASLLVLEVETASLLQDRDRITARLARIRARGVRVLLDDVGSGVTHLDALADYPVDVLKIPQRFVAGVAVDGPDGVLARMVIALGRSLGMRVIASGVESTEQRAILQALGCDLGQGYHIHRPGSWEVIDGILEQRGLDDGNVIAFPA